MAKIIGIDFGTTNSLFSVVLGNKVKSYLDHGMPHPSAVCYGAGPALVGSQAKKRLEGTESDELEGVMSPPAPLCRKVGMPELAAIHSAPAHQSALLSPSLSSSARLSHK